MKNLLSPLLAAMAMTACASTHATVDGDHGDAVATLGLIPVPMQVERRRGKCRIGPRTRVVRDTDIAGAALVEQQANQWLWRATGVPKKTGAQTSTEVVLTHKGADPELGPEGYTLEIGPGGVRIRAIEAAGMFYGLQTLRQLLPPESEVREANPRQWTLPCLLVRDRPRFRWRGMHLDVGRHFFPPGDIRRFLELLALHKFNVFHWHLTEDQGWRIEIKKWPKLTTLGAWRKESPKKGARKEGDGVPYGGFYNQDEIRQIVAFARERFITIVPEIEMPGHCQAAIAAYPQFGNTPEEPVDVRTRWGISKNVYSVEDQTFAFLEDVLAEVMELFPSPFIHIGGDECPKHQWKVSQAARQRMEAEGLKDEHALQSWFIQRIEGFLNKKGRRLIGWDEIQEGGLAPNATMMVWRDSKYGVEAVKAGHDIVMSPISHCYFDHNQADPKEGAEPEAIGGLLTLSKVYAFEPVPKGLTEAEANHVLGAQGNLWTEYIWSWDQLMYMAFPRACAMAEVTWSPAERRDFESFLARWRLHARRLDVMGVGYRPVDDTR